MKPEQNGCEYIADERIKTNLWVKTPETSEIFKVVADVQDEMQGRPLDAGTAFAFVEEVQKRVASMITMGVSKT